MQLRSTIKTPPGTPGTPGPILQPSHSIPVVVKFFFYILVSTSTVGQICEAAFTGSKLTFFSYPTTRKSPPLHPQLKLIVHSATGFNSNDGNDVIQPPNLTVILPAYNESLRIEETLRIYNDFLSSSPTWQHSSQILVVDDGSTDGTHKVVEAVVESFERQHQQQQVCVAIRCVSLGQNSGKGEALSQGIQHVSALTLTSPAELILIADADASADIACLDVMYQGLCDLLPSAEDMNATAPETATTGKAGTKDWNHPAMVVGRRTYKNESSAFTTNTKWDRAILRWGFRTAVRLLCGDLGVSDTQCGFKLMTLSGAIQLYPDLHLQGWSHDVEVLYRAKLQNIPVTERNVLWEDKAGSKLVVSAGGTVGVSLQMLLEISQVRPLYALGVWK